MEEKIGLIKGMKCQFQRTETELIDALSGKTGMDSEFVKEMMLYNIFTINQYSALSGLSVSHVLNKTRPSVVEGVVVTELDYCYPFRDPNNEGPKFIIRNQKSEKYLKI